MAATKTKAERQVKSLLDIQEIRREKALRAKASFAYFLKQAWHVLEPAKPFIEGIHTEACAVHLQALADGEIHRLVANLPPGFGKSTIFSVAYPAWIWTRNPHEKFLCASYAMDLSIRDRRNCRMLIESEWYQSLFGDVFQMAGDQNVKCLLGSTKIATDQGELAIQDIVERQMNVRVLTYNHEKSIIENKKILAYEKHPGRPCIQVLCSNGATVNCTLNHPFYVPGKGYVEAEYLQIGDTVYASQLRHLQERILPGANKSTAQQAPLLQHGMLRPDQASGQAVAVLQDLREARSAVQCQAALLQSGVSESLSSRAYLHTMQSGYSLQKGRNQRQAPSVLWSQVQRGVDSPTHRQQNTSYVPGVRKRIFGLSCTQAYEILLSRMLSFTSSLENAWTGTSAVWQGLWNGVYQRAQARRQPVYALSQYSAARSPSYRSRQAEQCRVQFDNPLSSLPSAGNPLPRRMGDVEATTVIALIPDVSPSFVYNLEIEDNHNYFANGILTHNSFYENDKRGFMQATATFASGTGKRADSSIIDDPNNAMAGKAEVASTREWFGKTWIPRLNDRENGTMIIVGQRLDALDLTAHVLELGGWTHLCLPMEYEPARKCYTSIGWEDTRTQEGELLCPKLVDEKGVQELKHSQGSIDYAAQQQQAPVPAGGSKFKEKWFRYYAETEQAYILKRANETKSFLKTACWKFGTVDLAISKRTSADFTVMCVWAVTPEMDLLLLHVFRDRVSDAESLAQLQVLHGFYRPDFWKFEVSFQEAIFNQALRKGIPCRPFRPDGDKERRATSAAVWLENEKVFYLEHAPWLDDWEAELLTFPKGAHDDQVDNQSMAALEICDGGDIPFAATSLSGPDSGILPVVYKPAEGEMSSDEEQDLQRRQEQVARILQQIVSGHIGR